MAANSSIAGLDLIVFAAQQLELPIDDSVAKVRQMAGADPDALNAFADRHEEMAARRRRSPRTSLIRSWATSRRRPLPPPRIRLPCNSGALTPLLDRPRSWRL